MNHRKHFVVIFVIFTVFIVLALSCASSGGVETPTPTPTPAPTPAPEFNVAYEYESETPAISVTVEPVWGVYKAFYSDKAQWGIKQFQCKFSNNTNAIAKVVWEGSSLYYDGNSSVPFIDGQKYAEADRPMTAAIIPRGGFLEKAVYSSEQVYYESGRYGGWRILPIEANPVQIIFQIDSENGSEYVVINVSYSEATNPS